MWPQVQSEADLVQDFVDFALGWLEDRHYTLTIDADLAGWAKVMGNAPSIILVNPTFDPRFSPVTPRNSFWLDLRVGSTTVAIMAARLFVTDDYVEIKRSTRLWFDPPRPGDSRLELELPAETPKIAGMVGHEGGLWVHPSHRKRGLSVILPHLLRALCFKQWNVDWQTGLTTRGIGECGIASWAYGMAHVVPCYEGRFLLTQRPDRLFLAYMSRGELVAGLDLARVARLLPDGHREVAHTPALVQEG